MPLQPAFRFPWPKPATTLARNAPAILAAPSTCQAAVGRTLALAWSGLLLGGVAMAVWAGIESPLPGDRSVARWIQDHDPLGTDVLRVFRDMGSTIVAVVIVLLAAMLEWIRARRWTAIAALGFMLGLILIAVLKFIVDAPRPTPFDLVQVAGHDSPSFPSGHVMGMVVVGTLVLRVTWRSLSLPGHRRWLRIVPTVWAAGMILIQPWVSVAAGVHWLSDTLGGLVWGAVFVIPAIALLEAAARRDARERLE